MPQSSQDHPTWANTLQDINHRCGHINKLIDNADLLGYTHICWNDRIYKVIHRRVNDITSVPTYEDTFILKDDLTCDQERKPLK